MKKFGKSSKNIINHKVWQKNNNSQLERSNFLANLYTEQPCREKCKICFSPLGNSVDFSIRNVGYRSCQVCTHLNGIFDDSQEYAKKIYESNDPEKYGKNYIDIDIRKFDKRVSDVYLPKADFLFSTLESKNEKPDSLKYLDIGAGAGHFLAALFRKGVRTPHGLEISSILVRSGEEHLAACAPGAKLIHTDNQNLSDAIFSSNSDVISLIGVLEHLANPHDVLKAFNEANNCRYLFLSIPMFSPSVCIEAAFPSIAPRHLEGGHTHLFTEKSINWLSRFYGWTSIGEWWFGSDMIDLLRAVSVTLFEQNPSSNLNALWQEWLDSETIDAMQLTLDKNHRCSELHILLKK